MRVYHPSNVERIFMGVAVGEVGEDAIIIGLESCGVVLRRKLFLGLVRAIELTWVWGNGCV